MGFKIWQNLTKANNIHESLRPLMYISLIGLAPFRIHSQKEVRTSLVAFIVGIMHFFFFVLCFILSLYEGDTIIGYFFQTNITKLGDATLSLSGIIVMTTIFNFALFKRHRIMRILQHHIVVDEVFASLGMNMDYGKIYRYSAAISLMIMVFNVTYLCVSYWLLRSAEIAPSFVVFASFALPHINISIMIFKFLCTTHLARGRFCMMNEILQDILNSHVEKMNSIQMSPMLAANALSPYKHRRRSSVRPATSCRLGIITNATQSEPLTLRKLVNVHNILCDICHNIEEYFAFPLLAIVASSFLFILFDDFYILDGLLTPNRVERVEADEFFTFFFTQMLWYVIIIILIVEGSSSTIKESHVSVALVHKLLSITDDLKMRERLLYFSMQLSQRSIGFTAAGLFPLDRTLIFTITGAATCYLIILLQFRAMPHHALFNSFNAQNSSQ